MEFLDWDDLRHMNFLDHYLDDLFRNSDDSLLDNWNLNSTIYNLFNLDNLFHNNVFNHFNVLDLDDWHQFLSNHFDLFDYCFNWFDGNWFLDNFSHLDNLLDDGFNWNNLLNVDRNFLDDLFHCDGSLSNNFE